MHVEMPPTPAVKTTDNEPLDAVIETPVGAEGAVTAIVVVVVVDVVVDVVEVVVVVVSGGAE